MSHARSAVWAAKASRLPVPSEDELRRMGREYAAAERLRDWLDELAERADEWRRFAP